MKRIEKDDAMMSYDSQVPRNLGHQGEVCSRTSSHGFPSSDGLFTSTCVEGANRLVNSRLALVNGRVARFQDLGEYEGFKEIQPHTQQDGNFL